MSKYIAAIDQGTTSTRCILFDHKGHIFSSAQEEHQQIYPKPGWVEHNPLEIWERCKEVMNGALAKNNLKLEDLVAGITPATIHEEVDFGRPVGKEAL